MIRVPPSVRSDLDSIFQRGATSDLSDSQLLDRVTVEGGESAESAFAVLVERHGPMVLRVCRHLVGNPHDAEDAYQAVFLVLARQPGSIRHRGSVAAWLFGVARKVSARARRDQARRRQHERIRAELSPALACEDPSSKSESWAELYQEIDRLPEKYRAAIVLCHLEGVTHEVAADRLHCPLRTLQSRLHRAKSRLRERLSRRGVAAGATPLAVLAPKFAPASTSIPLAEATARMALSGSAGSPPTVLSLAQGVLKMTVMTKIQWVATSTIVLSLVAGLTWAAGPARSRPPLVKVSPAITLPQRKPQAPEAVVAVKNEPPVRLMSRGIVVDEADKPVAGVEVLAEAFSETESRTITGPDGSFAVAIEGRTTEGTVLLARSVKDNKLGFYNYGYQRPFEPIKPTPRIVLKPARKVAVQVANPGQGPIPDATVEVVGNFRSLAEGKTNAQGQVEMDIPVDSRVEWVLALKSGQGFDYAEFGPIDNYQRSQGGVIASEIPKTVALVLDGSRTVKIRAVDTEDKPIARVEFSPWLIHKEGRRSAVNLPGTRVFGASSDLDGVATFDWLPNNLEPLTFWPRSEVYASRRVELKEGETATVTTRLTRTELIQGRVTFPDGSPAADIEVSAIGTGQGVDHGSAHERTLADGSYQLKVSSAEAYVVYVTDENWAASSRLDVLVLSGQPVERVDFSLARGILIRGRVTVGVKDQPAPNQYIRLTETGERASQEVRVKGDRTWRQVQRQIGAMTDVEGRYSLRVGPGSYTLTGPPRTGNEKLTLKNETEFVRNYQMLRAEKGPIAGRVVVGPKNLGVMDAKVEIMAVNSHSIPFVVTTDSAGNFVTERDLDRLFLCAKNADGSLGALVEVDAEQAEVTISLVPTASAKGLLVDEQGKPSTNQKIEWGRRIYLDDKNQLSTNCFATKVVTDDKGRFALPALVVGQEYNINVEREGTYYPAGIVQPKGSDPIDLGTLKIGGYRAPATIEEMSSFRTGGPGPGDLAPLFQGTTLDDRPLRLEDFRGKFVLLDFWATWCGPCIGEIPQLQKVHDAFGGDGRFAILSLSVDEKVEEPRKFQGQRKLAWSQGFLGLGLHSKIPDSYGVKAIPAFVLVGPDGKIVAKGMRGEEIHAAVAKALGGK